jgi:hypothetical protein
MTDKPIFKDNATSKIIAFDFDNTLCVGDHFPNIGEPRKYARQVVNKLHELGVKIVIWTCRDIDRVMDMADDIKPMEEWLKSNGIHYDSVNSAIEFAPFHYEARKIYAHMYVDDRAFGWNSEDENILLDVFMEFAVKHLGMSIEDVTAIAFEIEMSEMREDFSRPVYGILDKEVAIDG